MTTVTGTRADTGPPVGGIGAYLTGLRHVGVVSFDAAATAGRLAELLGVPAQARSALAGELSAFEFLTVAGVTLEVVAPVGSTLRDCLLASGTGVNHICLTVTDVDAALRAAAALGVRPGHVTPDGPVSTPTSRMVYLDPRDTAGVLIELVGPVSTFDDDPSNPPDSQVA